MDRGYARSSRSGGDRCSRVVSPSKTHLIVELRSTSCRDQPRLRVAARRCASRSASIHCHGGRRRRTFHHEYVGDVGERRPIAYPRGCAPRRSRAGASGASRVTASDVLRPGAPAELPPTASTPCARGRQGPRDLEGEPGCSERKNCSYRSKACLFFLLPSATRNNSRFISGRERLR
jgi:hypothetical protein